MPQNLVDEIVANQAQGMTETYSTALSGMINSSGSLTMFSTTAKAFNITDGETTSIHDITVSHLIAAANVHYNESTMKLPLTVEGGQITTLQYNVQNRNGAFYLVSQNTSPHENFTNSAYYTIRPEGNTTPTTATYMYENIYPEVAPRLDVHLLHHGICIPRLLAKADLRFTYNPCGIKEMLTKRRRSVSFI